LTFWGADMEWPACLVRCSRGTLTIVKLTSLLHYRYCTTALGSLQALAPMQKDPTQEACKPESPATTVKLDLLGRVQESEVCNGSQAQTWSFRQFATDVIGDYALHWPAVDCSLALPCPVAT
jgi:hypothetical protein